MFENTRIKNNKHTVGFFTAYGSLRSYVRKLKAECNVSEEENIHEYEEELMKYHRDNNLLLKLFKEGGQLGSVNNLLMVDYQSNKNTIILLQYKVLMVFLFKVDALIEKFNEGTFAEKGRYEESEELGHLFDKIGACEAENYMFPNFLILRLTAPTPPITGTIAKVSSVFKKSEIDSAQNILDKVVLESWQKYNALCPSKFPTNVWKCSIS